MYDRPIRCPECGNTYLAHFRIQGTRWYRLGGETLYAVPGFAAANETSPVRCEAPQDHGGACGFRAAWAEFLAAARPAKLHVYFYGPDGGAIENFVATAEEAASRIAKFVELHGSDPEGNGRGAAVGTVKFYPEK